MRVRSPAKLNLFLRVGRRRDDGYHDLISWFCSVGLCDSIEFDPVATSTITLRCDTPAIPCDQRNLIVKAADLLRQRCPTPHRGVDIHLHKKIPSGGGLGGGSSNAAVALRALARMWECDLNEDQLRELAIRLGSDVPFFLALPSAICRGRGERMSPFPPPNAAALLLMPSIAMPTADVYRQFDEMRLGSDLERCEHVLPDPRLPAEDLLPRLINDLEAPAFAISPELRRLRAETEQRLGRPVRMTGSGSTLFTLYDELAEANAAAARLARFSQLRVGAFALGVGAN